MPGQGRNRDGLQIPETTVRQYLMRTFSVAEIETVGGGDGLDGITLNGNPVYSGPYTMLVPTDVTSWYSEPPPHTEPIGPQQLAA